MHSVFRLCPWVFLCYDGLSIPAWAQIKRGKSRKQRETALYQLLLIKLDNDLVKSFGPGVGDAA